MADTFDRILFEGGFDPSDIIKGIDGMIATFKKAKDAGELSNETLAKMQGAIDGVTVAATEMQKATGKPLAAGLNDGKLLQQIGNVTNAYVDMSAKAGKAIEGTVDVIAKLKVANIQLTEEIKQQTAEYRKNAAEIQKLSKAQSASLNTNGEAYKSNAAKIASLTQANTNLIASIADGKDALKQSEAAVKSHTTVLTFAQKEHNKLGDAIARVTNIEDIGAKAVSKFERVIAFATEGAVFGFVTLLAGPVIQALEDFIKEATESSNAGKLFADTLDKAAPAYAKSIEDVSRLREEIGLAKDGFLDKKKVVEDYNESIGKTTGLVKNLDEAEQALNKNAEAYIRFTFLKAVANEANAEAAKKAVEASLALLKPQAEFVDQGAALGQSIVQAFVHPLNNTTELLEGASERLVNLAEKNRKRVIDNANSDSNALSLMAKKFGDDAAKLAKQFHFNPFGDTKTGKQIEDDFEKRRAELKEALAKLLQSEFVDEVTIRKEYAAKLDKAIIDLKKDKGLKPAERKELISLTTELNTDELNKALKDATEKRKAYLVKVDDELTSLEKEENLKRIANIQDTHERERETILAQTDKTLSDYQKARDARIAELKKNAGANGISPAELKTQIDSVNAALDKLVADVQLHSSQQLQKLSFDTFEKLSENARRLLDAGNLGVSQGSLVNIQKQTDLFLAGKLSYKAYQKSLTQIARAEAQERFNIEKEFLEQEIRVRQDKLLFNVSLTDDQKKRLEDEIRKLQQQLTDATKNNTITGASNKNSDFNDKLDEFVKYAEAIGNLTNQVIGFWQQTNEAESKALDKSIALQNQRVAQAQIIADHGNSSYLKLEEQRQQALIIQQENAARRTLAINAALQGSQLVVALISAIAQGAKVGGALGAITDVAAVVAAIAGAYAIAQSLKPPQYSFFTGTEDTGPGGNHDNKGGFAAILHPHERVVTAEQNKHFKGMSNKDLVEVVNNSKVLVESYRTPPIPQLNMEAMEMANQISATENIRLAGIMEDNNRELRENNMLQKRTHYLLKNMESSIVVNEHGLALSVNKVLDRLEKSKKM